MGTIPPELARRRTLTANSRPAVPIRINPAIMRTFLVSYQPARDEADEVIGVSISLVDITSRKQTEEALAESEDHYRNAVELNPAGSLDRRTRRNDPRRQPQVGDAHRPHQGGVPRKGLDPRPSSRRPSTHSQSMGKSTSHRRTLDVEYRIRCHDGIWRWMRARAAPRRDEDGKIIRWYGTLEDIDDHNKAEEALRRSEARLQAIFEAVPIGIVIADAPDGRVVMSNPRAEEILPHSRASYPHRRLLSGITLQRPRRPTTRRSLKPARQCHHERKVDRTP